MTERAERKERGDTVPLRVGRRAAFVVLGLGAYGLFLFLRSSPDFPLRELVWVPGAWASNALGRASAALPLPLAELFLLALLVRWVGGLGMDLGRARASDGRLARAAASGGLRVAGDVGLLVFLFYLLWGFGYAAPPLDARLAMPDEPVEPAEVHALALEMVDAANREYLRVHGVSDAGAPTSVPARSLSFFRGLDDGWEAAAREVGMEDLIRRRHAPPRPLLIGFPLRRAGISGLYMPFTGEALVLPDLPAVSLGSVAAHESAHQRGVHHEADASFVAFLAGSRSPDPLLRYSAYVFAQRQLLRGLAASDREAHRRLLHRRVPGVQRDLDDLREYWLQVQGPTTRLGTLVNDAYLRRQGIAEGVASYDETLVRLVRYARTRNGTLLPSWDGSAGEIRATEPDGH